MAPITAKRRASSRPPPNVTAERSAEEKGAVGKEASVMIKPGAPLFLRMTFKGGLWEQMAK